MQNHLFLSSNKKTRKSGMGERGGRKEGRKEGGAERGTNAKDTEHRAEIEFLAEQKEGPL